MKQRKLAVAIALVFALPAAAFATPKGKQKAKAPAATHASPTAAHPLPALLEEVEAKYSKASTLEAKFDQITHSAAMGTTKTSSGIIMVKRPNKVRWETLKPDKSLLVSDGRKFWFYTPPFDESEKGQVIEKRSSDVQSKLAQALLSGSFSTARDMKVREERPAIFSLTPKPGSAGTVMKALIEIDTASRTIKRVELEHQDGNRAEISLSEIVLGKDADDRYFVFDAPPGTDVIRH